MKMTCKSRAGVCEATKQPGRPFRDGADAMAAITTVAVDLVVERYSTEPLSLLGGLHHNMFGFDLRQGQPRSDPGPYL